MKIQRKRKAHSNRGLPGKKRPGNLYERFNQINGKHAFKKAVPKGFVDYQARVRKGGRVRFFNFKLAKEMGLVPHDHPHRMNDRLSDKILGTFSLQIINEWDIENKTKIPQQEILPNTYMATRYLQLQHPDKKGGTSGDGRSVWNGQIKHKGTTWDISSCGTGATQLSPATAIEKRFFKTGDPEVCYGCGQSDVDDGLYAAVVSEIFHNNGVNTERTLAVIEYKDGLSVNVRAAENLIRPAHLFLYLKQEDHRSLKGSVDYFIDREIANGRFPSLNSRKKRYEHLPLEMATRFAKAAALYQTEYIFVWMDWDGDNILSDGGIIDYGSIRQFGLYHHEYRYDDVDRLSTNLTEQREKARYMVQTFAQLADYVATQKRRQRSSFNRHPALKKFDKVFEEEVLKRTLHKTGLNPEYSGYLFSKQLSVVKKFRSNFHHFEKQKAAKGKYYVEDGVTWDAIYCMRDALRELPTFLFQKGRRPTALEFTEMVISSYASKRDRQLSKVKEEKISAYLDSYLELVSKISDEFGIPVQSVLLEMTMRASVINRYDRITGESALRVIEQLLYYKGDIDFDEFNKVIEEFIEYQSLCPDRVDARVQRLKKSVSSRKRADQLMDKILSIIESHREDI